MRGRKLRAFLIFAAIFLGGCTPFLQKKPASTAFSTCPEVPKLSQKEREILAEINQSLLTLSPEVVENKIKWNELSRNLKCQAALFVAAKKIENGLDINSHLRFIIANSCQCLVLTPWQQVIVLKTFKGQVPPHLFVSPSTLEEVRQ